MWQLFDPERTGADGRRGAASAGRQFQRVPLAGVVAGPRILNDNPHR
jgi:hypothetical protein